MAFVYDDNGVKQGGKKENRITKIFKAKRLMKKIYLLCLAMMGFFALAANAQSSEIDNTFRFQDANGNEVKDGTTLTLSKLENGQISTGLFVKNISGKQTARLSEHRHHQHA